MLAALWRRLRPAPPDLTYPRGVVVSSRVGMVVALEGVAQPRRAAIVVEELDRTPQGYSKPLLTVVYVWELTRADGTQVAQEFRRAAVPWAGDELSKGQAFRWDYADASVIARP